MSARTIHPFPARMAPEIALAAIPHRDEAALTVLDPMCGSGTVLGVAVQHGHNAIGVDIDPLAVMMSTLAVTEVDPKTLRESARAIVAASRSNRTDRPWGDDAETETFVDYWFGAPQKQQLLNLTGAIERLEDPIQQLALRLALSRIIVTKSPQASLAADTSHSRPHRVNLESEYDVNAGFERSANQLSRMLAQRSLVGKGDVQLGDARLLSTVLTGSADIAVTSPPYLNALDYLRGHKLALVWFGHKISDLRVRRSTSIGAERRMDSAASALVLSIVDVIEAEAVDKTVLKRPMLERFADDCIGFAAQLSRALKPSGTAVLVVGNSTLRGNYIKNDLITQKAMEAAGFSLMSRQEREIPPSSRYMALSAKDSDLRITKRMRNEVVLTMAK
jgi:DNA modification methylase